MYFAISFFRIDEIPGERHNREDSGGQRGEVGDLAEDVSSKSSEQIQSICPRIFCL